MNVDPNRRYGVITGDVVGSSGLEAHDRRRLLDVLHRCLAAARQHFPLAIEEEGEVFSGDSWQLLISRPADSLRVAIFCRTWIVGEMNLKGLDVRAAAAIGRVDFVPPGHVSQGDGEAFRLSGRTLAAMDPRRIRLVGEGLAGWSAAVDVLDEVLRRELNPPRARALAAILAGKTHEQAAHFFPSRRVDRSTITRLLERVYAHTVVDLCRRFSEEFDAQNNPQETLPPINRTQ